jgi:hypothetical protein
VEHPIPALADLLREFVFCFRIEVFLTFRAVVVGWVVCPGRRTIAEVWQATGLAARRHHAAAYALFGSARWSWDDLSRVLVRLVVARLAPVGPVWLAVDDTLCHKRGAKVAFGGFFLDAVTSTRRRKNFRFGVNWVVLGVAVALPFRPDRSFCLPVAWRVYRKKGTPGHRPRTALAAELARLVAGWLAGRECWLAGDTAYLNAAVLKGRPDNLRVVGPVRWDAALYAGPPARRPGQRGPGRKKGDRLPTPRAMIDAPARYRPRYVEVRFPSGSRRLRVQVVRGVLWYTGAGADPVAIVLVRDPSGAWRDTALLATDPAADPASVIAGYASRWGIEVAFFESKQFLGLHDPRVRTGPSVERAHPMAWLVQTLTVVWYAGGGKDGPQVVRDRPWYRGRAGPTFADMLGALRLRHWESRIAGTSGPGDLAPDLKKWLANWLAAVR